MVVRNLNSRGHDGLEDGAFGVLVPRINGFLSAIGCILIIYIIRKSEVKLHSTYHRIMFAISVNGIFTSIAIGCTYWLFPKDDEMVSWPYLIPENIQRYGSTATCEIQGALVITGYYIFETYVASLCVYYFCALVLRMKPESITKWIEWFLHLSPLIVGLVPAVLGLKTKSFNPGDSTPWCAFRRYPAACPTHCWTPDDEGCECIRGSPKYDLIYYKYVYTYSLYIYFAIIFASLFAICMSTVVAVVTLFVRKNTKGDSDSCAECDEEMLKILRFRVASHKSTLVNTLLYISVMMIVFISLFMTKNLSPQSGSYEAMKGLRMVAISGQGLVFFLIFLFINVRKVKETDSDIRWWEAVKMVFKKPPGDVVMVNVELLMSNNDRRRSILHLLEEQDKGLANEMLTLNTPNGALVGSCMEQNIDEDEEMPGEKNYDDKLSHALSNNLEGFSSYGSSFMGEDFENSYMSASSINIDVKDVVSSGIMKNGENDDTGVDIEG